MNFTSKIKAFISEKCLYRDNDKVVVALSGGADSVALLLSLLELKSCTVCAAHLNHMIRGEEADRDESFCRFVCESLQVPLYVERINVPAFAKEKMLSLETAARDLRYEFLDRAACHFDGFIATAHNANDNLETLLLNLGRGTGLSGLCGIPPIRHSKNGVRIIRPLLCVTREEIEGYLKEKEQPYCIDSTNFVLDATRNKLRHSVLPAFLEVFPEGVLSASRSAMLLSEYNGDLDDATSHILTKYDLYGVSIFENAPKSVASRAVKRIGEELCGCALSERHINALLHLAESKRGFCDLPNLRVSVKNGYFVSAEKEDICEKPVVALKQGAFPLWGGYFAEINGEYTQIYFGVNKKATYRMKTSDIIPFDTAVFRTRREGDKVFLPKRNLTKSLKKLFNELKSPLEERDSMPILAVGSKILLLPIDEFKVQD